MSGGMSTRMKPSVDSWTSHRSDVGFLCLSLGSESLTWLNDHICSLR